MNTSPAGWYQDPAAQFEFRYWDGAHWTEHVSTGGVASTSPLPSPTPESEVAETHVEAEVPSEIGTRQSDTPPVRKIGMFGVRKKARSLIEENEQLQRLVSEFGIADIVEKDSERNRLDSEISEARTVLANLEATIGKLQVAEKQLDHALINLRNEGAVQEYGLYDYENPAESSVALATELESVRSEMKRAVRDGQAATATSNFTFNNSTSKGKKFVRDMTKLLLRAYNAEAENCVKSVKAGNLAAAQKRLSAVVDQVERLGSMIQLRIHPQYHRLRLTELELTNRHLRTLQVEKELERARREELREQKKADAELARERERLEKERSHYTNAIAALEAKGDLEAAAKLREKLSDVDRAISDVDYRAANVRAGYVYVISNVGAFGPDVVKIGLTRRLEPMDRVHELGDASVPFRFDVHALFFADDAVGIENMLHKHFTDRRLNTVNLRREYFRTTPAEVLNVLKEHNVAVLEYKLEPDAPEYRASIAAQRSTVV